MMGEDDRVREFVCSLMRAMTLKQIKDATGHSNIMTIGRLCNELADAGIVEPLARPYGAATRVAPDYSSAGKKIRERIGEGSFRDRNWKRAYFREWHRMWRERQPKKKLRDYWRVNKQRQRAKAT